MRRRQCRASALARWWAWVTAAAVAVALPACGPIPTVSYRTPCACYGDTLGNDFAPQVPARSIWWSPLSRLAVAWELPVDSGVSGPPVSVGGRIYFGTWRGTLIAASARDGAVLWRRTLGTQYSSAYGVLGITGSPAWADGRLYVADGSDRVYALDPSHGRVLWSTAVGNPKHSDLIWGSVRVWAGRAYVGISSPVDTVEERGRVVALDARNGRILWTTGLVHYAGGGASVETTPAAEPALGLIFVGTGNPTPEPLNPTARGPVPPGPDLYSDSVVALSAASGRIAWYRQTHPHDPYDLDFEGSAVLFPTPAGEAVGAAEKGAYVYAFAASSGAPLWQTRLGLPHTYATVVVTPAYADGHLVVVTMDNPLGGRGAPYGRVVALEAASGQPLWSVRMPAIAEAAPLIVGSHVLAADIAGDVVALALGTGKQEAALHLHGLVWGGFGYADGLVLVPVSGKPFRLVALR